jgi:hypothetical protein
MTIWSHPDRSRGLEVGVEIPGPHGLEVDEIAAELGPQWVVSGATVEHVGPFPASGPAEHLGELVEHHGVSFLGLQCPGRGHEQGGRANARLDVPAVIFGTHVPGYTPGF